MHSHISVGELFVDLFVQGCVPNGCCRSESGKLIADQQYLHNTYVTHDGHVASCSLLNSSAYCSCHRVRTAS